MIDATATSETDNLLDLQSVTKAYRLETKEFLDVKDINLQIKHGEFVCLLGPVPMRQVHTAANDRGIEQRRFRRGFLSRQPLTGVNPHTTIVFQTFALYPWLTVQENVEIALKARGLAPESRTERALKLIDVVGLDGLESV